jgi:hypothetical protein
VPPCGNNFRIYSSQCEYYLFQCEYCIETGYFNLILEGGSVIDGDGSMIGCRLPAW